MKLIVSSLADVPVILRMRRPSHMISLLDPDSMIPTPRELHPARHLRVGVNDIAEACEGLVCPTPKVVEDILAFGRGWNISAPMLIHCWAGISRSTATAFILACERNPEAREADIAQAIRAASSAATPNRLMTALADDLLGRGGRMVDAIGAIGAGEYRWPNPPFELSVRFP